MEEPIEHHPREPGQTRRRQADLRPIRDEGPRPRRGRAGLARAAFAVAALLLIVGPVVLHVTLGLTGSAVLTDSMRPSIRAGDLIVTRRVDASELQTGQVAVLDVPGHSLLAHRIEEVRPTPGGTIELVTKGDANQAPDEPLLVEPEQSVLVMVFRIPDAGYVANFFTRPEVLTLGVGLLLVANVITIARVLYPGSARSGASEKGGGSWPPQQ